jgi:hypothetical protein
MKALETAAAAILAIGAVYMISVIGLAFAYHTLKALGM